MNKTDRPLVLHESGVVHWLETMSVQQLCRLAYIVSRELSMEDPEWDALGFVTALYCELEGLQNPEEVILAVVHAAPEIT